MCFDIIHHVQYLENDKPDPIAGIATDIIFKCSAAISTLRKRQNQSSPDVTLTCTIFLQGRFPALVMAISGSEPYCSTGN